jgi:hypothetical protein
MATSALPQDFKEFLKLLNSAQVEYLLVGGYAVGYHGSPRATADMDLWIAISHENALKTIGVLAEFGFSGPNVSEELFTQKDQVIRMGNPPFRIELITGASGVDFEGCYARRVWDQIDGVPVSIISLEDLKANKRAAGRPKDLADLDVLP